MADVDERGRRSLCATDLLNGRFRKGERLRPLDRVGKPLNLDRARRLLTLNKNVDKTRGDPRQQWRDDQWAFPKTAEKRETRRRPE